MNDSNPDSETVAKAYRALTEAAIPPEEANNLADSVAQLKHWEVRPPTAEETADLTSAVLEATLQKPRWTSGSKLFARRAPALLAVAAALLAVATVFAASPVGRSSMAVWFGTGSPSPRSILLRSLRASMAQRTFGVSSYQPPSGANGLRRSCRTYTVFSLGRPNATLRTTCPPDIGPYQLQVGNVEAVRDRTGWSCSPTGFPTVLYLAQSALTPELGSFAFTRPLVPTPPITTPDFVPPSAKIVNLGPGTYRGIRVWRLRLTYDYTPAPPPDLVPAPRGRFRQIVTYWIDRSDSLLIHERDAVQGTYRSRESGGNIGVAKTYAISTFSRYGEPVHIRLPSRCHWY